MPDGLDISEWQEGIPIGALAGEGIYFVIHRQAIASSGRIEHDETYDAYAPAIRAQGIRIGHYFFNGPVPPDQAADYFVDHLSGYTDADILALDIEGEGLQDVPWATVWFRRVLERIPTAKLFLYTTQSIVRQWDWSPVVNLGVRLWIAAPGDNSPYAGEFGDWAIHQYTWTASIAGFGPLDGNHSKDDVWSRPAPQPTEEEELGQVLDTVLKAIDASTTDAKNAARRENRYRLFQRESTKDYVAIQWSTGAEIYYGPNDQRIMQWDVDDEILAPIVKGGKLIPEPPVVKNESGWPRLLDRAASIRAQFTP